MPTRLRPESIPSGPPPVRSDPEESVISTGKPASWAFTEQFVAEPAVTETARSRAEELGCTPVSPGTGAALRLLAASLGARAVVEVGTGTGVSGLWLLEGMAADGVLTTIDVEAEHQRAAREAFADAGIKSNRARLIPGRGLDVLPRLTDAAYDLVLLDADAGDLESYTEQAVRLLRPGGILAIDSALWHDRVPDPAQRDETTTAVREAVRRVREDERLVPALLPCGDGLLVAVKR